MTNEIESISVDLIDDPHAPMRTQMDDEKLDELARSIKSQGLISPITLRKNGERYEVIAGHRRLKACKRLGLPLIASIVLELNDSRADEMRMHENLYREDVNPVDEARYIKRMIDTHNVEPEKLAEMTGKSVAYLQARYDLLSYPDYLVAAVEAEQISLTAAQWLTKIDDDRVRSEYTRFAILGGITAKRAEAWYRSWLLGNLPRDPETYSVAIAQIDSEPRKLMMPCVLCCHDDDIENMGLHYAHLDCVRVISKVQSASA